MARKAIKEKADMAGALYAIYAGIAAKHPGTINAPGVEVDARFGDPLFQIPTGSIGLDMVIGPVRKLSAPKVLPSGFELPAGYWNVGLPAGRISEFYGWESSGKTSQCLMTIARAQAMGLRAAYIDMEHALDLAWATRLGVRVADMPIFQPDTGEQALDIAHILIQSGQHHLIVVDSVSALIPEASMKADNGIGDAGTGLLARLLSTALQKINPLMTRAACHLILINQNRMEIKFGQPARIVQTGGKAMRFYASTRVEFSQGQAIVIGTSEESAVRIGHSAEYLLRKSKVSVPLQKASAPFYYDRGTDPCVDLVMQAIGVGVISKAGAWYSFDDLKGQGLANMVEAVRRSPDPGIFYRLYDRTMSAFVRGRGLDPEGGVIGSAPQHSLFIPVVG